MHVMPAVFSSGDTIYFPFDAYNAAGASLTISGLAVTDIEVYKNGSTTQRASDNGYALLDTDGIDFDGTTGLHGFSIDTSDNSDASFWVDGAQYWVNINSITVDGQTVRFTYYLVLGLSLRPVTPGRKLVVDASGLADANTVKVGPTGSGTAQTAGDLIKELFLRCPNKTFVVAASGGSDSNPGYRALPLATVSAAETAGNSGDTIHCLAGTFSTAVSITKQNMTLQSDGETGIILVSSGTAVSIPSYTTLRNIKIQGTGAVDGVGVFATSTTHVTIDGCTIIGTLDGMQASATKRMKIIGSLISGDFDGANVSASTDISIVGSRLTTTGNFATGGAHHALYVGGASGLVDGSTCIAARTVASSIPLQAMASSSSTVGMEFRGVNFIATATALNTADVAAVSYDTAGSNPINVVLRGGWIRVSNSGTGTARSIDASSAGSRVRLSNVNYDASQAAENAAGTNIVELPAAALMGTKFSAAIQASTATDASTAATQAATAATQSTTAATQSTTAATQATEANAVVQENLDAKGSEAGGGGTPAQVHNDKPVPAFTATLGTRADGVIRAYPAINVTATSEGHVWINCTKLLSDNIEDVTDGESSDEDVATITSVGMYEKYASIKFDSSGATAGDTVTFTCNVPKIGPVAVDVVVVAP